MEERETTEPAKRRTGSVAVKPVRLSVNLAPDVAAALKELVTRHGTSITEEVRRAISVYKFFDEQTQANRKIVVEGEDKLMEVKFF